MHLISVDLPAPLSPSSASTSPRSTSRSTPSSAVIAPKRFVAPRTASAGAAVLIGRPSAYERVEGVWGNREVPPRKTGRRGFDVGETWFPPRERAEGERRSQADDIVRANGHARQVATGRVAERRDDGGRRDHRRRLTDALHAIGRAWLRILDELRDDRRHVERRRDEVVGEVRVEDLPVPGLDLLHQRQPEPLGGATLDLAFDRLRVDRFPDVLRRPDPDDARQAELDVDLGDDLHRRARERNMRGYLAHLSRLRVERRGQRVTVHALDIDIPAAARRLFGKRRAARLA